jgi:hypothetical protein
MSSIQGFSSLIFLSLLAACATTGATFGSGVGDALVEHPPYYAGTRLQDVRRDTSGIGHLPVAFQPGATQPVLFDPRNGEGTPLDALLELMNAYLDSLGVSERLVEGGRISAVAHADTRVPPDVRFGCLTESGVPGNECQERGDSALGRGTQLMQLSVGRPSRDWVDWIGEVSAANNSGRVLVVTLEIGDYLLRQEGFVGTKVLELGTGHRARLPWLTSLETPVTVLQLTGVLVDRSGKAVRIGAEGFYARRTRLTVSAIGGQEVIGDEDLIAAAVVRRDDLPGAPLAWQVAIRELVTRLTGRS